MLSLQKIQQHNTMKKIRVLTVVFEPEIHGSEIPAFRGAIIAKAGRDCVLFHNHQGEGYRYKYPLIQYKRIKHHASIVCIEQGIDEIYRLFNQPDWKIRIGREEKELKIIRLNVNQYTLNVWDKTFRYKIFNWLPLNEENYRKYRDLDNDDLRLEMLERILVANILSFAKGIGWRLDENQKIIAHIQAIERQKLTKFKGTKLLAMDVVFTTNVYLPPNIGLGKAVSHGYGKLVPWKNKTQTGQNTVSAPATGVSGNTDNSRNSSAEQNTEPQTD